MNRKFKALVYATQLISNCLSFHTRSTGFSSKLIINIIGKYNANISKQETIAKQ